MYTCEAVLKTAQETGESGEISRNHWEIRGNSGGNSREIGELCFPNWETEFPGGKINFLHIGKKKNCFTKIPIWGICVKQVGEMKEKWKGILFSPQVSIAQYCKYQDI